MSLWESQDAAQATGGKNTFSWIATGVSIDTRTIQPGDLFVALKADRDGHEFVNNAFDNGCLLYTSPSPRDKRQSRMPSSA